MKTFISIPLLASLLVAVVQAAPINNKLQARSPMSGDGTFYKVGSGSCGGSHSDKDMVAAISSDWMGKGAKGSSCGKSITVKGDKGSVKLKVIDTCPGCSKGDVDMSKAAFEKIARLSDGRVPITWSL